MLNLHFFQVVRDNFKILCIQINLPAYKDCLCSNFKWFDSHSIFFFFFFFFFEKNGNNGKNVVLEHIAFCTVVFQQIIVYV